MCCILGNFAANILVIQTHCEFYKNLIDFYWLLKTFLTTKFWQSCWGWGKLICLVGYLLNIGSKAMLLLGRWFSLAVACIN